MIDIKFIARKAGVSISTVSRVINRSKPVSKELECKVLNIIKEYDYSPNKIARGLVLKKSNLIGVVMPTDSNQFLYSMLFRMERYLNQLNYEVIISSAKDNFECQKKSLQILNDRNVDGIVCMQENSMENMIELQKLVEIPVDFPDIIVDGKLVHIGINDEQAGYDATSYLINLGHKKIGGLFYGYGSLIKRKNGFVRALREHNLEIQQKYMITGATSIKDGIDQIKKVICKDDCPTALFCVSDEMAIGVMLYLLRNGYRIPEDISIISVDNIDLAEAIQLTTIHQSVDSLAMEYVDRILSQVKENQPLMNHQYIVHELIVRTSCCVYPGKYNDSK